MPALINIVGNKYNSLTVIERAENINGRVAWNCLCECGRYVVIRTGDLTTSNGHTKTCGNCDNVFDAVMYEFKNGYVIGHVKNGRKFLIDEEDLYKIKNYPITVDVNGYTEISIKGEKTPLHRFLMNAEKDEVVDHINRNPNDNRRDNLRICTDAENLRNKSLYKNNKSGITGVLYHKNRWYAAICYNYKNIHLGTFINKEDAIRARKQAEEKYFGEFAPK